MRPFLLIIFIGVFLFQINSVQGQVDSTTIVSEQWQKVQRAQLELSQEIVRFSSINEIRTSYPEKSIKLIRASKQFAQQVGQTSTLDSTIISQLEGKQDSLLRTMVILVENIRQNKELMAKPSIMNAGKRLEQKIQNLTLRIHEFNYWVNEKNGFNLRFTDIGL